LVPRVAAFVTVALLAAACGDDAPAQRGDGGSGTTSTAAPGATVAGATPATPPAAPGTGGSATLAVGDDTWTFDRVACAFGEQQIGQEGAEFVLTAFADGIQLYVSIDPWGHTITIDDIANFDNPSVGWSAGDPAHRLWADPGDFIVLAGRNVSATVEFWDTIVQDMEFTPGELRAECP
jgi:hypothetical protein